MKKILLVDDNKIVIKLVSNYLTQHNWQIESSDTPFGVLGKVREFVPDIILLDLNMPGLNGVKVAELLRAAKTKMGFKLVFFSSEEESLQQKLVSDGLADGYIIKGRPLDGMNEKLSSLASEPAAAHSANHH